MFHPNTPHHGPGHWVGPLDSPVVLVTSEHEAPACCSRLGALSHRGESTKPLLLKLQQKAAVSWFWGASHYGNTAVDTGGQGPSNWRRSSGVESLRTHVQGKLGDQSCVHWGWDTADLLLKEGWLWRPNWCILHPPSSTLHHHQLQTQRWRMMGHLSSLVVRSPVF